MNLKTTSLFDILIIFIIQSLLSGILLAAERGNNKELVDELSATITSDILGSMKNQIKNDLRKRIDKSYLEQSKLHILKKEKVENLNSDQIGLLLFGGAGDNSIDNLEKKISNDIKESFLTIIDIKEEIINKFGTLLLNNFKNSIALEIDEEKIDKIGNDIFQEVKPDIIKALKSEINNESNNIVRNTKWKEFDSNLKSIKNGQEAIFKKISERSPNFNLSQENISQVENIVKHKFDEYSHNIAEPRKSSTRIGKIMINTIYVIPLIIIIFLFLRKKLSKSISDQNNIFIKFESSCQNLTSEIEEFKTFLNKKSPSISSNESILKTKPRDITQRVEKSVPANNVTTQEGVLHTSQKQKTTSDIPFKETQVKKHRSYSIRGTYKKELDEISKLFNDINSDKDEKDRFLKEYEPIMMKGADAVERSKNPSSPAKYEESENGDYQLIKIDEEKHYAGLPRFKLKFSENHYVGSAMGQSFQCKGYEESKKNKSYKIKMIEPALFISLGEKEYKLIDNGELELMELPN